MKRNLNRRDGIARSVLGLGCIAVFFLHAFNDEFIETISGVVGLVLLTSAIFEFCPFYYFLGIKTRHRRRNKFY